jgi:DNA-directed RNA polymerase subunit M/transcription elongation factor TFIIS
MPKQEPYNPELGLERSHTFLKETRTALTDQTLLHTSGNEENATHHTFVMSFCPKCEALLEIAPEKSAELYCRKCKYRAKLGQKHILEKKIDVSQSIHREIAVLNLEDTKLRTFPAVHKICPECNNGTSEIWTMAIGSEGTTGITFLRCTACGYTRREAE